MVDLAIKKPLSHIGISFVCDKSAYNGNPQSMPILLSLAMSEKRLIHKYVVDLRNPSTIPVLQRLFDLPVHFVGHDFKRILFSIWAINLTEPQNISDSFIHEEASDLGKYHIKYQKDYDSLDLPNQIRAKEMSIETRLVSHSLQRIAFRNGIPYTANSLEEIEQLLANHPEKANFSDYHLKKTVQDVNRR